MKAVNVLIMTILVGAVAIVAFQGVACALVAADFTADQTSGQANYGIPFVVHFTDTSTGSPTSWQWNFGDNTANSTVQNPAHSYTDAGAYTVTLTASNGGSSDTEQKVCYINVLLWVNGTVGSSKTLSISDLTNDYAQITITNHQYGRSGGRTYYINATGASLNEILDSVSPSEDSTSVTFYASDGYSATILLSTIRGDNQSMIAVIWNTTDNTSNVTDGLRNILPSQYYAQYWVKHLVGLKVNE